MRSPRLSSRGFPNRTRLLASVLVALAFSAACDSEPVVSDNPLPALASLDPDSLYVGVNPATVLARGTGFTASSIGRIDGEDRPTTLVDASHLRVTLAAKDIATGGRHTLVIVNGPPGGGTSGEQDLWVLYPHPTVSSIEPALLGLDELDGAVLRIFGTGFTAWTRVTVASRMATAHLASSKEMSVELPDLRYQHPTEVQIQVQNPSPGGGPAEPVALTVGNPVPVLESVEPLTVQRGTDTRISVLGRGFVPTSVLIWGGVEQPTTVVGATSLYTDLAAAYIGLPGSTIVEVVTPGPGGGTTASVLVNVVPAPPEIVRFTPTSAPARSAGVTLDVLGRAFTPESVVWLNGKTRTSTFVDSTTLRVALSALDVLTPGAVEVQVVNPEPAGASRILGFPVLPAVPTRSVTTLALRTSRLVSDPSLGLVYASVPVDAPAHANEVVAIDPANARIVWSTPVGSDPDRLAISEDGAFLYVVLRGATSIARIDVASHVVVSIALPTVIGEDIAAIKGSPLSFAVSLRSACSSCLPRHAGVAVFDDDVMRPTTTRGHTGSNVIEGTDRADRLYGYNNETTEYGFRRIQVGPDGLVEDGVKKLFTGVDVDIAYDRGVVFTTTGYVVDPERLAILATLPASGAVRPDMAKGRVHYYDAGALVTLHGTAYTELGRLDVPEAAGAQAIARFGKDGLAFGGGTDTVVFLRSDLIG